MLNQHFSLGAFSDYHESLIDSEYEVDAKRMNSFQKDAFELRNEQYLLLNAPCGSGKTLAQIWLACHDVISSGFTQKQLILAPQLEIAKEFSYAEIEYEGRAITWSVDKNLSDDDAKNSKIELKHFLLSPPLTSVYREIKDTVTGLSCISTHQLFVRVWQELSEDEKVQALKNLTLRIDEAHHIKNAYCDSDAHGIMGLLLDSTATYLGKACKFAMNKSPTTKIHLTTATFYRGDHTDIFSPSLLKKFRVYVYSWVDFWKTTGIRDIFMMYCEDSNPIEKLVTNILAEPEQHHLIILPKTGKGIRTSSTIQKILDGTAVLGSRVLDLVTLNSQRANKISLRANPSAYNVVISCALFNEGANWKPCSRIHNLDCEKSPLLAVQRIGRGLRRHEGKDKLKVIYYPRATKKSQEEYANHTTSIAIAMHVGDLFDPVSITTLTGYRRTLGEIGPSVKFYTDIVRKLGAASCKETGLKIVENAARLLSVEFEEEMTVLLMKKIIKQFSKVKIEASTSIEEIHDAWGMLWEQNSNETWVACLNTKTLDQLKTILTETEFKWIKTHDSVRALSTESLTSLEQRVVQDRAQLLKERAARRDARQAEKDAVAARRKARIARDSEKDRKRRGIENIPEETISIAAEMLNVQTSEIWQITQFHDALYWEPVTLATKQENGEKFDLRGEFGESKIRIIHQHRTSEHPPRLFSTKKCLQDFASSPQFKIDIRYQLLDNNKFAKSVLRKYQRHNLLPAEASEWEIFTETERAEYHKEKAKQLAESEQRFANTFGEAALSLLKQLFPN